jgi:diguanylate cyclase (GGDEF)-like protein
MGLRGKIISLFFIGFGLMAYTAFEILHTNLQQGFVEIERKQATDQMIQLAHNLNNELNRLHQLDIDWASWDAMANFTQHPSQDFIQHQIIPGAFQTLQLKFILILDKNHNTVFSDAFNLETGKEEDTSLFDHVFTNVKKRIKSPVIGRPCGLDTSVQGPLIICWQPIHRIDQQNKEVGTLVIGQLLDERIMKRIQEQSGVKFELNLLTLDASTELQFTQTEAQKATIELENMEFVKSQPDILVAHLNNIVGQPVLEVRLQFSNDVSQQGRKMMWELMRALLLITFSTSLALLLGIHFLVIRRLRNMETELNSIWRNSRWAGRLSTKEKPDEIGQLASSINRMLTIIRQQVVVLEQNAHTDSLTLLANRRAFDQNLSIEMSLHKRNQTQLSILMLDVDYFKRYNDTYGHPAGDEVLKELGKILSQIACRPSDLPARIGGEEFAVILPGTDLEGANFVAEKIAHQLARQQIIHRDSPIAKHVTVSIGVTSAGEGEDVTTFLQRADKAAYNAKQTGRNKICILPTPFK